MSTMEHKPMGLAGIVARCVLLTPKGVRPDTDLLAALDRRDLTLVRHDSEFTAIAEICRCARDDAEAIRRGRRGEGLILLLMHPHRLNDPAGLVHAVERYAPHAAIWMFSATGSPRLRSVTVNDVAGWVSDEPTTTLTPGATRTGPAGATSAAAMMGAVRTAHAETWPASPSLVQPKPLPLADRAAFSDVAVPPRKGPVRQDGDHGSSGQGLSSEELSMLLADDPESSQNE